MADRAPGRVILVGGGPGADDLITVRGLDRLLAADVVITDRLAPVALLSRLGPQVEAKARHLEVQRGAMSRRRRKGDHLGSSGQKAQVPGTVSRTHPGLVLPAPSLHPACLDSSSIAVAAVQPHPAGRWVPGDVVTGSTARHQGLRWPASGPARCPSGSIRVRHILTLMPDRPPDPAWLKLDAQPGLCGSCRYAKLNETRRGTAYLRCTRAGWDTALSRYPRLPVTQCAGFEPYEREALAPHLRAALPRAR